MDNSNPVPEHSAPEHSAPEHPVPEHSVPEHSVPDEADPVANAPAASATAPPPPAQRSRDRFLDTIRAVAIVRVIVVHLLGRLNLLFWPAPTFVAPGMPMVFFISGALARQSLRTVAGRRRSATTYWRATFRRLLVPYWAFYGVVVAMTVAAALLRDGARYRLDVGELVLGASGLVIPTGSPVLRHHTGHLWFLVAFMVCSAAAPPLVRLYERIGVWVVAIPATVFAVIEWRAWHGTTFTHEVYKTATFAVPYVVGFAYTDPPFARLGRRAFLATTVACASVAAWTQAVHPGAANDLGLKHLATSGAWFALALAAAPAIRLAAARGARLLDRVTRRTMTIYLWGWPTSVFAWRRAGELTDDLAVRRGLYVVFALGLLSLAVATFGWVEDVAAKRVPLRPPWPQKVAALLASTVSRSS
ncbi:MAG: acyltransferase [Actinobacteria bacterium]|nr:acyltransferase [Actinomycetota bacterium]